MRGQMSSARELRRERLVGNWGGASEQIGRRWETMGLEMLQSRVESGLPWPTPDHRPEKLVSLESNEAVRVSLSKAGLPNPDVIVVLRSRDGQEVLQALDFKWNLEFASYGQIRAEAIQALLHRRIPPLRTALSQALGRPPEELPVLDGILLSPELAVNRWFLQSEANARQEYPVEPHEVIFEEVDPFRFFEPLPGWEMALLLARLDRSDQRLRTLEGAEHYYRIGAGLMGAVSQLQVSIFVRQPPSMDATRAGEWLRSRARPPSSAAYLQHAERLMSTRSQLLARLRNLVRSPYRFVDLVEALRVRGVPLPEREEGLPAREKERWGNLLRKVAVAHRGLVYRTGLKLVEAGLSDAEALARLEADPRRFTDRARIRAEQLAEEELGGTRGNS